MRRVPLVSAGVAILASAGFVVAQQQQSPRQGSAASQGAQSQDETMTVLIQKVDPNQKSVTASNSGEKKLEFKVQNTTPIATRGGEKKQFSDLKPGIRAKLTYTGPKTAPQVCKIEIAG